MHLVSRPTDGPPRLGAGTAASVGVLALAAALAVGHLVAAFVGGNASPYLAVGNTAVDLTPAWLKDLAVALFGTADKLVLLAGMAVVLVLLAVAAGLASRRRRLPGLLVVTVLGLVGIAAVLARRDVGALAPLAPVASLITGLVVFDLLHRTALRAAEPTTPEPTTPGPATPERDTGARGPGDGAAATGTAGPGATAERTGTGRRAFLVAAGGVGAAAGLAGFGGELLGGGGARESRAALGRIRPDRPAPPLPPGADFRQLGTPSFVTRNDAFYRIDTALVVPQVRPADWSLRIHGMVARELTLTWDDVLARELVERRVTLCCVSNPVGGPYVSTSAFTGVVLADLLAEAGVRPGAQQLFSTSADGWTCGTPIGAVTDRARGALLAVGMNRRPLPLEHGYPARLVVPGLYGYVSATKWVVDLEVTTWDARTAYWRERDWAREAPVKTQSRVDTPREGAAVPVGTVTAAGVAWAQPTGIDRVQVRLDDGPWVDADLAADVSDDTWRMWRADVRVRAPGGHRIACRAVDAAGRIQPGERAPVLPDGATGWHTVSFTARP